MVTPSTSPVSDYVGSTITQIREGLPKDAQINGPIRFELSTVIQSGKGGQLNIGVLNLGGDASAQATQKVSFEVRIPTAAEESEEAAKIAESEYRRVKSEQSRAGLEAPIGDLICTSGRSNSDD